MCFRVLATVRKFRTDRRSSVPLKSRAKSNKAQTGSRDASAKLESKKEAADEAERLIGSGTVGDFRRQRAKANAFIR